MLDPVAGRLSKADLESYRRDGYLVLRGAIPTEPIDRLMRAVAHVIRLESGSERDDAAVLNEVLIALKQSNPSSSSWIYQTIQSSWALKQFFTDIDIVPYVCALLEMDDPANLGTVSPAFRFDIPGDTRNIRTWHQDSAYFLENEAGRDHLVTWIPLNRATRDNGSVIIAPGSHRDGRRPRDHSKASGFASEQYTSPIEGLDPAQFVTIEAEAGDIAFIDMDLLHSSGTNVTSDEVRYTAQIRFNTINRPEYRPVFLRPEYPEYERNQPQG